MDEENIYYYALHNEVNKLFTEIIKIIKNAISGDSQSLKKAEDFKTIKRKLIDYDKMLGILFYTYHNVSNSFYSLSDELKKLLEELEKYNEAVDNSSLESAINSDIVKINYYDKIAELHKKEAELLQLAYRNSLSNVGIIVNDKSNPYQKTSLTYEQVIKKMIELEIGSLDIDNGSVELKQLDIINNEDDIEILDCEDLDTTEELNRQREIRKKANKVVELCKKIKELLEKEQEVSKVQFLKLHEIISTILNKNQDTIDKANAYIMSFSFGEDNDIVEQQELNNDYQKEIQELTLKYNKYMIDLERLKTQLPEYQTDLDILERKLIEVKDRIQALEESTLVDINSEVVSKSM